MNDCGSDSTCLSQDSGYEADMIGSMQGKVLTGQCSSSLETFQLSAYDDETDCSNKANLLGAYESRQGLGWSDSYQSTTFGICNPLPYNALEASFLYNNNVLFDQLYIKTTCDGGDLKFNVYSDSGCINSIREMDFGR